MWSWECFLLHVLCYLCYFTVINTDFQLLFYYFVKLFCNSMPLAIAFGILINLVLSGDFVIWLFIHYSDFYAHSTEPNAEPDTNDISPFLSSLLIKTISYVCADFFIPWWVHFFGIHDGLVSSGKVSGGLYKFLLENPSWLYHHVFLSMNLLIPCKTWNRFSTYKAHIDSYWIYFTWPFNSFLDIMDFAGYSDSFLTFCNMFLELTCWHFCSLLFFSLKYDFILLTHHAGFWGLFRYCAPNTVFLNSLQAALKYFTHSAVPFSCLKFSWVSAVSLSEDSLCCSRGWYSYWFGAIFW